MNKRILILVAVYITVILVFAWLRPEEVDWRMTLDPDGKTPFSSRVLYQELQSIRPEQISRSDRPILNTVRTLPDSFGTNYVFLTPAFRPTPLDLEEILAFVHRGNQAVIATADFPRELMDTLGMDTKFNFIPTTNPGQWFYEDNLTLYLTSAPHLVWHASTRGGYLSFMPSDTILLDTLGFADASSPNFVAVPFGKGTFYLHAFPQIFTNYHMLYQQNHQYISRALSAIPESNRWTWDQYYLKDPSARSAGPLGAFTQYLSFRWAYWTAVAGILIFIVFTAKRMQRVIPVLKTKRNMTLDFTRTIGDLYFHRNDTTDLIQKKLEILRHDIRQKYRTEIIAFSDEEARQLVARSAKDPEDVVPLFSLARQASERSQSIRDLWDLQRALDRFYERA